MKCFVPLFFFSFIALVGCDTFHSGLIRPDPQMVTHGASISQVGHNIEFEATTGSVNSCCDITISLKNPRQDALIIQPVAATLESPCNKVEAWKQVGLYLPKEVTTFEELAKSRSRYWAKVKEDWTDLIDREAKVFIAKDEVIQLTFVPHLRLVKRCLPYRFQLAHNHGEPISFVVYELK